jgi:vancomycin permeability regulator SanA
MTMNFPLHKTAKLLKLFLIGLVLVLTLLLALHLLLMLAVGFIHSDSPADAIVIYGNKVEESGEVSERLKSRLDTGLALYEEGRAPLIIVSGGFGKEGFSEALVMRDYLIDAGIATEAIWMDEMGNSTYDTGVNMERMMSELSCANNENESLAKKNQCELILVSQYYHLLRAQMFMKRVGFETVYGEHARGFWEIRDLYSIPREMVGFYVYLFKAL